MAAQHHVDANITTDCLEKIPENIAVSYLPESDSLSKKVLEKGLNYFTQGYVHNIRVSEINNAVRVDARCWRSMRKNETPHNLHIEIGIEQKLSESYCTCKAGLNGHCSHIVGLLKSLQGLKLHNFSTVPDQQSCTSIPQQWHVPRGTKINPVPLNHLVVARPVENRKRRPVLCHFDPEERLPAITERDIQVLKDLDGTPLQYMLSSNMPMQHTPVGNVKIGSFLSYQTRNLKKVKMAESVGCGNTSVVNMSPVNIPQEFISLNNDYDDFDNNALEKNTRQQSNCSEWFEARKNRLTASNFGKVLKRKSVPSEKFLTNLFCSKQISAPALDYGKRHENTAKAKYLQLFNNRHFHECGLVINKQFMFLGATPDGIVCDNGKSGIIEIKCPFTARNMKIVEACETVNDFYLENIDGQCKLKTDHEYYAQIQGQLMITGCDFCEFIVLTQCDLHTERVLPNLPFMNEMLNKLCSFFQDFAKPFLDNKRNKSS